MLSCKHSPDLAYASELKLMPAYNPAYPEDKVLNVPYFHVLTLLRTL